MPEPPEAHGAAGGGDPAARAADLCRQFPLPEGAGPVSVFSEAASVLGGTIHLAGVSSERGGETICGSAAALDELPLDRAYFELLERLSVVRAMACPGRSFPVRNASGRSIGQISHARLFPGPGSDGPTWRAARSSGVAIGSSWERAARSAHWELLERDRVLRSWYGEFAPSPVCDPAVLAMFPEGMAEAYDVRVYELGSDHGGSAAGVFAFPRGREPLVYGFAGRSSRTAAVSAAAAECLQRLGFLWGESIPSTSPPPEPSPAHHQEFYLVPANHSALHRWLRGQHARYRGIFRKPESTAHPAAGFEDSDALPCVDLTPPELMGSLFVAKAIDPRRAPLVFGLGHPWLTRLPRPVRIHPLA